MILALLAAAALQQSNPPNEPSAPIPYAAAAGAPQHAKGDPLESFNRRMFRSYLRFDRDVFGPVARGYKKAVPNPVRSGLRNALSNLTEPVVFLNYLLQLKPGKAIETFGRFLINSTLGFGGLVDMAKTPGVRLPHRPNGFGNTLGFYGVKPGPFLFLPVLGPTTFRDLFGGQADGLVLPLAVGKPFDRWEYVVGTGVISGLDKRAESEDELKALLGDAVDPYATLRSSYLQVREAEIRALKGKRGPEQAVPGSELEEPLEDPGQTPAASSPPQGAAPELEDPLADPAQAAPESPKPD